MASFLITGCSRGLGLALVQELLSLPSSKVSKIFATARGDSPSLNELAKSSPDRVVVLILDVTNEDSVKKAAAEVESHLQDKGLDYLINNAGIAEFSPDGIASMDNLPSSFTTNVLGVHYVTRTFLPLLRRAPTKKIINMSTTLASFALQPDFTWSPTPAYKISKAAMNMLTVQYAQELGKEGFTCVCLVPGWLKTDLGGENADLTAKEGARACLDIILNRGQEMNGQFPKIYVKGLEETGHKYDGKNAPW